MRRDIYVMLAKTMAGLENILADELKDIGATDVTVLSRAISFKGDKQLMYKANLWCRTALRILKPIAVFEASDEEKLYEQINAIEWEKYLGINDTLAIDTVIARETQVSSIKYQDKKQSSFTNSLYISQKAKDAMVDRFYKLYNQRPSVDLESPTLRINLHIKKTQASSIKYQDKNITDRFDCTVSLDSSGVSLHKRGYRQKSGLAPINEVLAAGLILLSGWKRDCNFIDPMCGSGTFLVEAAMIANNIPAGYYRREYGFQKWNDFDLGLWNEILADSLKEQIEFEYDIKGSDVSETAIKTAEENIKFARLHKDISLQTSAFANLIPTDNKGFIIMNPPYGERMKEEKIIELYKSIGDTLKTKYAGYEAWVISSDMDALKFIGLKPTKKIKIFNGPLECRFIKFDVYEGSKRK